MKNTYIIALGASDGGQTALKEFFDNTPVDAVSYVVVTHLKANFKAILPR